MKKRITAEELKKLFEEIDKRIIIKKTNDRNFWINIAGNIKVETSYKTATIPVEIYIFLHKGKIDLVVDKNTVATKIVSWSYKINEKFSTDFEDPAENLTACLTKLLNGTENEITAKIIKMYTLMNKINQILFNEDIQILVDGNYWYYKRMDNSHEDAIEKAKIICEDGTIVKPIIKGEI